MKDSKLSITVNLKTGHLIRTIEVFENALHQLKKDLSTVKDMYCENDGEKLEVLYADGEPVYKMCPQCGERSHSQT